ncbi:MAG: anhydro-N-acetylmuramic acid kinase [Flavobacterium sp.]
MTIQKYNMVGVMSGTSLDGVDLAHIQFTCNDDAWQFEIGVAETVPYSDAWVNRLKEAVSFSETQLQVLNQEYTQLLGNVIKDFILKHNLKAIDAVCSHGHTILHQPHNGVTLQIGNLPDIAKIVGEKVVCDFRVHDVQLGGQGAPLVPIGDRLLFSSYDACLNLGGFSNISFEKAGDRVAYDICPVNTVLNHYSAILGFDYDSGGKIAASAKIDEILLSELNALEFYRLPFPKSLGFEFVKETVLPLIDGFNISPADVLATFTEHIATQIANVLKHAGIKNLLVTGGGAYNTHLIGRMKQLLPGTGVEIPDDKTIQYKEALIFALLGVLKLRGDINVLASVTGAAHDHSSGFVYLP